MSAKKKPPVVKNIVTLGDEQWSFTEAELDLTDAFALKNASGLTVPAMMRGATEYEPAAMQAAIWFCRFRAGEKVELSSINFKLLEFDWDQVELPCEDEPDPTTGSASTP